jgi:hypothetical protein
MRQFLERETWRQGQPVALSLEIADNTARRNGTDMEVDID